jgi:3-deoxy-D-manno-octulosonic-acid transferase
MILGSPYLLIRALWGHHGIRERLGFIPKRESSGTLYWFHAASVGEQKILSSLIPELKKIKPELEIAVSTTTATGKRRAQELFGDKAIVFYQPLEINSAILRTIENLKPDKLILVETEIWPLLISTAAESGLEVDLINARLSARSFRFYRWVKPLMKYILEKFSHILAQTETDASRFAALGAKDPQVLGNVKFDQALLAGNSKKPAIKQIDKKFVAFVAGSIRKGEDRIFADLIQRASEQNLPVFFILVPRHMKDLDELIDHLNARHIQFALWSDIKGRKVDPGIVLIVNTMGELTNFYVAADLAFVGGSLVPIGGHDPVEPAALGKPVIFGPYMENASQAARILVDSGGAQIVKNEDDLLCALHKAIENRQLLSENGRKCREAILSMAGVSRKIAEILTEAKN